MDEQKQGYEELQEPMSPNSQYISNSVMSLAVIGVLETEIPIQADNSLIIPQVKEAFLPTNPRFSSIMVEGENGEMFWRRVEVSVENHVHYPVFSEGSELYDECFNDYLSEIAMTPFSQNQPPWEIHIIKYPTKTAPGHLVFKFHHGLGDGYSLMGLLLSCLTRRDDPSLPIEFSQFSVANSRGSGSRHNMFKNIGIIFWGISNTVSDFMWSMLKSTIVKDDVSPIRSGVDGVEFRPMSITTVTFSMDHIKQMKAKLNASVNDVICGIIFLGTRLYMQTMDSEKFNTNSTALVLMNTRATRGYKTVKEMLDPSTNAPWGNYFAFLHVSLPKLTEKEASNPLNFVLESQKVIESKKKSAGALLTGILLETLYKFGGLQMAAKLIYGALNNSSMSVSNIIGSVHQLVLAIYPIKGIYFVVAGSPQNLEITMMSYMQNLRIVIATEKGMIDVLKFKLCIEKAFTIIQDASMS